MADQEILSQVLRRFAVAMTKQYDTTEVLHQLCDHAVEVIGAPCAGVAVLDDKGVLRFATASSDAAVAAEKAQEAAQSGPCLSSIEAGQPLASTTSGTTPISGRGSWTASRTTSSPP
jgi:hypothetical protein